MRKKLLTFMMVMFAGLAMSVSAPKNSMVVQAEEKYVTDTGTYSYEILEDETVAITDYTEVEGITEITVPSEIIVDSSGNGRKVTDIGDYAFSQCSSLTSITIPDSVRSIGESAFEDCNSLTSITIPETVTSIGESAFNGCSSLTSITIPETVTTIGGFAFYGCSGLTNITIPETITSIGVSTFNGCSSLTSITIPEMVTSIGDSAFNGCSGLMSITIPDSVTSIGERAFDGCSSLTSITIPDSVTSVGFCAFYGTAWLEKTPLVIVKNILVAVSPKIENVTIPDSVTSIGEGAFYKCGSLTSITIPETVTTIGGYAFNGCSSLASITIPDSVSSIGGCAFGGTAWLRNELQKSPLVIVNNTLIAALPEIENVTIPDSVTSIGESAFEECSSLTSIMIPDSVTTIGGYAFYECSSLKSIYYGGTEASWKGIYDSRIGFEMEDVTIYYNSTGPGTTTPEPTPNPGIGQNSNVNITSGTGVVPYANINTQIRTTPNINNTNSNIAPKGTNLTKVTAKKKAFVAKWKKQSKETTGYQIQYSTSKNFKGAKITTIKKNKVTSITVKKLKAKKKYYVRIRTYKTVEMNGKSTKLYSDWSKAKTVTTKK